MGTSCPVLIKWIKIQMHKYNNNKNEIVFFLFL